ncbi:hypothetical protein [Sphingobacterium sp. NPDC055346]
MKRKLTKPTKELRDTNPIVTFEEQINQTDEGTQGYQFSSLLLKPKSNQTDEGAHGYQKQLESVKASAHLRWLFAQSNTHEKNALMSGISSFKILLLDGEFFESIPRPIPSRRATAFFPFFRHWK